MSDLTDKQSAQSIKIAGADSSGSESSFVNASGNGELLTADGLSGAGVTGNLNLALANTAYEAKVGVSALANRKSLVITALDDIFWGYTNAVTTSTGIPLYKNQSVIFNINPNSSFSVFLIAAASNKNARIAESV